MTARYAAGVSYWRDPAAEPAPRATKLLLLSPGGVAVIGHWAHWYLAWSPLPRVPAGIKGRIAAAGQSAAANAIDYTGREGDLVPDDEAGA
jgi:hypothetical protein